MQTQAKREPMLLFEFDAALFQFEQREPELESLFQLPPNRAASFPSMPLSFLAANPRPDQRTHLGNKRLRRFELVNRQTTN